MRTYLVVLRELQAEENDDGPDGQTRVETRREDICKEDRRQFFEPKQVNIIPHSCTWPTTRSSYGERRS